jgi:hypothetical protein
MILAGIFIIYIGYLSQQKTAIFEAEHKGRNSDKTKRQSTNKSAKGSN